MIELDQFASKSKKISLFWYFYKSAVLFFSAAYLIGVYYYVSGVTNEFSIQLADHSAKQLSVNIFISIIIFVSCIVGSLFFSYKYITNFGLKCSYCNWIVSIFPDKGSIELVIATNNCPSCGNNIISESGVDGNHETKPTR